MASNFTRVVAAVLVGLSTAIAIVAASIFVLLNPLWVGFEQARTGADRLTGYTIDDVHGVTNGYLGELLFGPGTFLQQIAGVTVLDVRERQHLADVRAVMLGFFAVAILAVAILVVAARRSRDRAWLWRSVGAGSGVLSGAVVVVGVVFALFFDQAFDFFHRLFFASGSYTFDPAQERLVQLFPEAFWSETSIVLAVVVLVAALAVTWFALRRIEMPSVVGARAEQGREVIA